MLRSQHSTPYWLLICLSFLLLLTSCSSSSVRVLDYWTSDQFEDYSKQKFLVACKAIDTNNRIAFEHQISRKMKHKRIDARESNLEFSEPDLTTADQLIASQGETLIDQGYGGVVFASVKNVIESDAIGKNAKKKQRQNPGSYPLSHTYVIEARIYDLQRPREDQLVGVNLVSVTDPKSADKLVKRYSKVVGRHFKRSPSQ